MRGVFLLFGAAAAVHPHPKQKDSLVEVDAAGQAGRLGLHEDVGPPPDGVAPPVGAQPAVSAEQLPGLPGAAPAGATAPGTGLLPDPSANAAAPQSLAPPDPVVADMFGAAAVKICSVAGEKVHLVQGSLEDFHFLDSTAAVLNIGGFNKGTGALGGMAKTFFSAWSMREKELPTDFEEQAEIQQFAKESKTNPVGRAWISRDLGNDKYVVYNGGTYTPEAPVKPAQTPGEPPDPTKDIASKGYSSADYFDKIEQAYREVFDKIPIANVNRIVLSPIASGQQRDPDLIFDEETPTWIAASKLQKLIAGEGGLTASQDFYLVGYSNPELRAMCKLCQVDNMAPSGTFGNGMCGRIAGTKDVGMFGGPDGGRGMELARAMIGSGSWRPYGAFALVALLMTS